LNIIKYETIFNTIGDSDFVGAFGFVENEIMNDFQKNQIIRDFRNNRIKSYFKGSSLFDEFNNNNIDKNCYANTFNGQTSYNNIGPNFEFNTCLGSFSYNTIGDYFYGNEVGDGFGFGGSYAQGNKIGNNFYDNTIGEYFYNNIIPDNFQSNTVYNYFQWNNISTLVIGQNLLSCVLYETTSVNIFKNREENLRLSYYDESDVLTVEPLNENVCFSFTIQSSDFGVGTQIYLNTNPIGVNGVDGFQNTAPENWLGEGYYGQGLSGESLTQLTNAYNQLGFSLSNSTGYLWNVTWGSGSSINSGVVKFGAYVNGGTFDIQAIDTSDISYTNANNNNGTSLVGTFLFPATFTIYTPLTNKSGWC
jgi:hypothetical protein